MILKRYRYRPPCLFARRISEDMKAVGNDVTSFWSMEMSANPLWPVRHFENSQRRACALPGVSGCVHLEPRKTNVRRAGERV